jgi:hypothetical protein
MFQMFILADRMARFRYAIFFMAQSKFLSSETLSQHAKKVQRKRRKMVALGKDLLFLHIFLIR